MENGPLNHFYRYPHCRKKLEVSSKSDLICSCYEQNNILALDLIFFILKDNYAYMTSLMMWLLMWNYGSTYHPKMMPCHPPNLLNPTHSLSLLSPLSPTLTLNINKYQYFIGPTYPTNTHMTPDGTRVTLRLSNSM